MIEARRKAADAYNTIATELWESGLEEAANIGFRAAAAIDLLDAELQSSWGGPFNGQAKRRALFLDIVARIQPMVLIETGTYRGTTTQFMAENFPGPILTCEANRRFFLQSQQKLARFPQVQPVECDSRLFLEKTLQDIQGPGCIFVYLDAHWEEDLPLAKELEIISQSQLRAVVMIDDFAVPFDSDYSFDDYGPGKILNLELVSFLRDLPIKFFFPAAASAEETGARRGCCVITTSLELAECLIQSPHLRHGDWRDWKLVEAESKIMTLEQLQQEVSDCRSALEQR
ncbi:hypothetical protein, partial [Synechococcus sp. BA-132 BA5]|uniref:hypothetical protein n=1 Tax=Synechococcus sp. BA-132 BA5 TaxID=3110252 RepID=UPI002B21FD56